MAISFNLMAGASSAPITVAADTPVFIVANTTTVGYRGTAYMSVEHATGSFLEWTGVNACRRRVPTLAGGFTSTAGTNMITIDYSGTRLRFKLSAALTWLCTTEVAVLAWARSGF